MLSQDAKNADNLNDIRMNNVREEEVPDYYYLMDIIDEIQYSCKEGDELISLYNNLLKCVETVEMGLLGNFIDSEFLQSVINDFMKENDEIVLAYIRKFFKTLIFRLENIDYDHEVIIDVMAPQVNHEDFGHIASIALAKVCTKSEEWRQAVLNAIDDNIDAFSTADPSAILPLFSALIKGEIPEGLVEFGIETNDPRFFVLGAENPQFLEAAGIERIFESANLLLNEEEFAKQAIICLSKLLLDGNEIEVDVKLISNYFFKDMKTSTAALFVTALASERDQNAALCASTVFDPADFIDGAPFHVQREASRLAAVLVIALPDYFYKNDQNRSEKNESIIKLLLKALEFDNQELQDTILRALLIIGEDSFDHIEEDTWELIEQLSEDIGSAAALIELRNSLSK